MAMLVPVFPLSLTLLIAVADGVPNWDMTPSCRAAAKAAHAENASERQKACIDSENKTREKLAVDWSTFPAAERTRCVGSIKWFSPTYTELVTCLEMYGQIRSARQNADTPIKPATTGLGGARENAASPNTPP
jgi:hypothetical protein